MGNDGAPGQVLGAAVTLTAFDRRRADELIGALKKLMAVPPASLDDAVPLLVLETDSSDLAERAFDLLEESGGSVAVARVWVDPVVEGGGSRPACPKCGSLHTQPFAHAGPGARVNMQCIDCGHRFKHAGSRA